MNEKQIFQTTLEKHESNDATLIFPPFDLEKVFGAKRVPVKVIINGAEYRTTVFRMDGKYMMVVPKHFREAAGVKAGETITVEMERDTEPRIVEPPQDLRDALNENAQAKAVWEKLSYTHQKEYANAVLEAKKPETRTRRIQKAIEELATKRK